MFETLTPTAAAPARDWMTEQLDDHVATARATALLVPRVRTVGALLCEAFAAGGTLWTFGNGGSAADAQHLTGEIIGHYRRDRRPLGAVTLSTDPTTLTCIANDYDYDAVFARQIEALAHRGDVVAAFSTTGNSANVVQALAAARVNGATTVLFSGGDGGAARQHADHELVVPSTATPRIQEMHTFMLHAISEMVDAWADGDEDYR